MIYLDYNATAPVRREVAARMAEVMSQPLNASSVHSYGREAKKILEASRKTLAESISAFPTDITFTGSATEANNWVLSTFSGKKLMVSSIEHSSLSHAREGGQLFANDKDNLRIDPRLRGGDSVGIPVTSKGLIDLGALEKLLVETKPALVSVMLANNETGVIQPIADVVAIAKKYGALVHTDAVQGLGKIPVDFQLLGVDFMTLAAHKCGGPVGAAALVVKQGVDITPMLRGGGQELRRRAGTENIAAIAGWARAVELFDFAHMKNLRGWMDTMEAALPGATVFGQDAPRLPNTSCLAIHGMAQETLLMKLDLAGFAVSAGSACSSGRIEPSHVLAAMGAGPLAANAIRISGGWATKEADIQAITAALKTLPNS